MNGRGGFAPNRMGAPGINQTAAPSSVVFGQTPQQVLQVNERQRRHRLVRLVSLGILIGTGLLIPTTLIPTPDVVTLVAVSFAFVGAGLAYLLNRMHYINSAGYAVLIGMMIGLGWEIVAQSLRQGGLDLNDLRVYDLFILPIVLSAVLVTRRGPIILAAISITFTITSLLLLTHSPTLQQYWDGTYPYALGSSYDVVIVAVVLQGMAAMAAWLGADSVRRALLQAYRVDEVTAAKAEVEAQQRRLQRGIANIQRVHAAVAHGQWDARAQVEAAELVPVAVSLNLLLDRLSRLTRDQETRQRVDRSAHELALALRRLRVGEGYAPPAYTGTPLDEVLVELDVLRTVRPGNGPTNNASAVPTISPANASNNAPFALGGMPTPAVPPVAESTRAPVAPDGKPDGKSDGKSPIWRTSGPPVGGSGDEASTPQAWPAMQGNDDSPLPQWLRES